MKRSILLLASSAMLSACSLAPRYERPTPSIAASYPDSGQATGASARTATVTSVNAVGTALLFVFQVLAALYESWAMPVAILLVIPFGVLGAFLGLWLRALDNNVYTQIGLAAKNAILIVEFAKLQREQAKPIVQAALDGAKLRLRPILMTSFAFILGSVPLAIALGAGAGARQALGTAVVFGMLIATLVGVFFIPVFYVMLQRISERQWPFRHTDKATPAAGGGGRAGVPAAPVDSNQP